MATGTDDVRFQGMTGSSPPTTMTRLTHLGHLPAVQAGIMLCSVRRHWGQRNEAARVHYACRRCSGCMAARRTSAATSKDEARRNGSPVEEGRRDDHKWSSVLQGLFRGVEPPWLR